MLKYSSKCGPHDNNLNVLGEDFIRSPMEVKDMELNLTRSWVCHDLLFKLHHEKLRSPALLIE